MINDTDVNKIVVSNKVPFGKQDFKYCIGYKNAKKIRSWCVFYLEMSIYRRDFNKYKFLINIMKFEKKLAISSKKNLIIKLCTIKNI